MKMSKFIVRRSKGAVAIVSSDGKDVATMRPLASGGFELEMASGGEWTLGPRVKGEVRPFSLEIAPLGSPPTQTLTIRSHVFQYGGRFYMMKGTPEDVHPRDHVLGERHIIRLSKFPFSSLDEVDRETWGRLGRLRGESVGKIGGLGVEGHTVELSDELEGIGVLLAAASFLLYSAA